jgi:hypothetical protein
MNINGSWFRFCNADNPTWAQYGQIAMAPELQVNLVPCLYLCATHVTSRGVYIRSIALFDFSRLSPLYSVRIANNRSSSSKFEIHSFYSSQILCHPKFLQVDFEISTLFRFMLQLLEVFRFRIIL